MSDEAPKLEPEKKQLENYLLSEFKLQAITEARADTMILASRIRHWTMFIGTLVSILLWKASPTGQLWIVGGFVTVGLGELVPNVFSRVYLKFRMNAIKKAFEDT